MVTYTLGEEITIVFVIEDKPYEINATFLGTGRTIGGVEFGHFQRSDKPNQKPYLLSKKAIANMQGVDWPEVKDSW